MPRRKSDTIRAAVQARVAELGLNAREVADRAGGVSHDQIWRYLRGDSDLTSGKLDAILRALGLRVVAG